MRFENFLSALDMGQCEDQLQRQALFDLALLFVMIDGVVAEEETRFMRNWLDAIPWTGGQDKNTYYDNAVIKCQTAIDDQTIDDFIAHRARQLIDKALKQQALQLANDIAHVDGELDARELRAIEELKSQLKL